ncbi:multidrug transporter [Photobacterium aquae]|uniref:Multidrug transporter n=1 Tax=Photobacterium aquae TaxID=1195763 RepID=A0A0J1GWH6_9GAMM|nr:MFS transporter [Photobacterium aquae]KLV04050.1 multidrug transporter [Photobacterium aquae]
MPFVLICCFSLVLFYPLGIDLYLVGLPEIAQSLNANEQALHLAFSIYLFGMASTMLAGGYSADKIGRKPITLLGCGIFIVGCWLAAISMTTTIFFIARFLQGIGAGFCYVVAFAILRDILSEQRRAKVLSMINGITCIVPVLAPGIGYLILLGFTWPSLFYTMLIIAVLIALLCLFGLKETRPPHTSTTQQSTPHLSKESFNQPYFISRVVMTSLCASAILTYVNTSPILIMGQLGFTTGQYSTAMAGMAGVSMATSFTTPLLLEKLGQRNVALLSQGLLLCAAVIFIGAELDAYGQHGYLFAIAAICAGFSMGFGTMMSQGLSLYSSRAGLASSILGVCQVSFSALFIWLSSLLGLSATSMQIVLLVTAGMINIGLIIAIKAPSAGEINAATCHQPVTLENQ